MTTVLTFLLWTAVPFAVGALLAHLIERRRLRRLGKTLGSVGADIYMGRTCDEAWLDLAEEEIDRVLGEEKSR